MRAQETIKINELFSTDDKLSILGGGYFLDCGSEAARSLMRVAFLKTVVEDGCEFLLHRIVMFDIPFFRVTYCSDTCVQVMILTAHSCIAHFSESCIFWEACLQTLPLYYFPSELRSCSGKECVLTERKLRRPLVLASGK